MLEKENQTVLEKFNQLLKTISKNPLSKKKVKPNENVENANVVKIDTVKIDTINIANKLLEAAQYELYFQMVDEGYQPTKEQKKQIEKKMANLLAEYPQDKTLKEINFFIEKGFTLSCETVYKMLYKKMINEELLNKNFFNETLTVEDLLATYQKEIDIENNKREQQFLELNKMSGEEREMSECFYWHNEEYSKMRENQKLLDLMNKYPALIKEMRNKIFTDNFIEYASDNLFKSFYIYGTYYVQSTSDLEAMMNMLENAPHIFLKDTHVTQFLTFISAYKNGLSSDNKILKDLKYDPRLSSRIENTFSYILKNFYKNQLDKNIHNVRHAFSEQSLDKKIVKQVVKTNYSVNDLPVQTKEIVNSLKKLSLKLNEHNNIAIEKQHLIQNIFENRIPEVLKKYLSIDSEYRTTLTNSNGKNAEDLMHDALLNYKNKLEEILKEVNENNLQNLSATQRYSQAI